MKTNIKLCGCIIIIAILAICALVVVFCNLKLLASFSLVIDSWEKFDTKVKNNPYITANYQNWKTIQLSSYDQILIPDNWNLNAENGKYYLTDNEEYVLGIGGTVWDNSAAYDSIPDLFADIIGFPPSELTFTPLEDELYDESSGNYFTSVNCLVGGGNSSYYYIVLCKRHVIVVPMTTSNQNADFTNILQAVVYSSTYLEK